ncbi:MAG: hypothetical protein IT477_10495, partial [Rhodanobacteraceae bacterium]|nr:hypothetical protein [Rhodanobacteraceae bacterium]
MINFLLECAESFERQQRMAMESEDMATVERSDRLAKFARLWADTLAEDDTYELHLDGEELEQLLRLAQGDVA